MPRSDAIRKLEKVKDKIGQVTDAEIAEEAGVSLGSVRGYRKRHGIAPAKTRRATRAKAAAAVSTRKARGKDRKPRRSKVGAVRHLLGNISDSDVAKQAGVTVEAVRMYRRRHSIDGHVPASASASASANAPRRRRSALDPYFDMLGTVPDSEIGALAGVTGENVRAYRRRHGIDATWKGAKNRKPAKKATRSSTPTLLPVPAPSAGGAQTGFLVTLKGKGDHVVVANNIASAVSVAVAAGSSEVIAIRTLGPVLG
jgi:DNA-binding CsgD family transcriptional regulator